MDVLSSLVTSIVTTRGVVKGVWQGWVVRYDVVCLEWTFACALEVFRRNAFLKGVVVKKRMIW